jgi:tripartite-type tricarboxylate transporter receptor subunit TctC
VNAGTSTRIAALLAAAVVAAAPGAHAQSQASSSFDKGSGQAWPNKPIRMTVASGPGGGLDLVARLVAAPMGEALHQNVVVDNRPGASGSIAAEVSAVAAPDGYTLMVLSASLVVYGVVHKTRYDLLRDFEAVSQIAASPYLLTIHPGLPVQSVKELVAYAKSNPGKLNYASTGPASLAHLSGELFAMKTGTQLVHIPYKGVGAGLPDMLSGRTQMSFFSGGSVSAQIRQQKLKPLAVASPSRSRLTPDLPTMIESGVPDFVVTQWHGLLAPRGTPRAIVERLHAEVVKAVQRPEVSSRLALDGTEPVASSPREFAAFLRSERDQWAKVAKTAKIQAD